MGVVEQVCGCGGAGVWLTRDQVCGCGRVSVWCSGAGVWVWRVEGVAGWGCGAYRCGKVEQVSKGVGGRNTVDVGGAGWMWVGHDGCRVGWMGVGGAVCVWAVHDGWVWWPVVRGRGQKDPKSPPQPVTSLKLGTKSAQKMKKLPLAPPGGAGLTS